MSWQRVAAIVHADFLVRFRRVSTVVVFLLFSAIPYLWVPDPAAGKALLRIAGRRALYNSATIGVGTASLAMIFIGLVGFYVVSNALRHDLRSRCGYIIASTRAGSLEYLFGKFVGNLLFLTTFIAGFMLTSMVMLIVRAEAPLEPLVFVGQYLLLLPPVIVFVSVAAIVFESIPWLSGRLGDVVFFFVWVSVFGVVDVMMKTNTGGEVARYLDFSGFTYMMENLRASVGSDSLAIGSHRFDAAKPLFVFDGLSYSPYWLLPRIGATLIPLPLLLVARVFFHRFDPARVRVKGARSRVDVLGLVNRVFKPVTRALFALAPSGRGGVLAAATTDALMVLTALPVTIAAIGGCAVATMMTPEKKFLHGVLPTAFAALALAIADIASREKRMGTTGLLFAAPALKTRFVLWKFGSAMLVVIAFLAVPALRLALLRPQVLPAFAIGAIFVAATATMLGIVSSNPKTFVVAFLSFWYLMISDPRANRALDFAGFYGGATAAVTMAYAAAAVAFLGAAEAWHRYDLQRRW